MSTSVKLSPLNLQDEEQGILLIRAWCLLFWHEPLTSKIQNKIQGFSYKSMIFHQLVMFCCMQNSVGNYNCNGFKPNSTNLQSNFINTTEAVIVSSLPHCIHRRATYFYPLSFRQVGHEITSMECTVKAYLSELWFASYIGHKEISFQINRWTVGDVPLCPLAIIKVVTFGWWKTFGQLQRLNCTFGLRTESLASSYPPCSPRWSLLTSFW